LFGVPAHLAGAPSSDSRTYSTVAEDSRAFVRFGLRPWVHRLEAALSNALPRGQSASISVADFMQPDMLTRYQAAQIAIEAGFKTVQMVQNEEGIEAG
ncbi:MAG: phage portal protein, partial [Sphingomonas sp.]|uniref:phage portal protein n=1 Tax=Sphingomonas sp. TaxID=28214 RepID=UPI00258AD573